jgi:hypothetical protein
LGSHADLFDKVIIRSRKGRHTPVIGKLVRRQRINAALLWIPKYHVISFF